MTIYRYKGRGELNICYDSKYTFKCPHCSTKFGQGKKITHHLWTMKVDNGKAEVITYRREQLRRGVKAKCPKCSQAVLEFLGWRVFVRNDPNWSVQAETYCKTIKTRRKAVNVRLCRFGERKVKNEI